MEFWLTCKAEVPIGHRCNSRMRVEEPPVAGQYRYQHCDKCGGDFSFTSADLERVELRTSGD